MDKFKDFRKSGVFRLACGVELHGELSLKGGASVLDLYSDAFFNARASRDIVGTFHDRYKVSLIHCITMSGPGHGMRGGEQYHFSSVFPHVALFGDEHISSADSRIAEVSFVVDDASSIFHNTGAFGAVLDVRVRCRVITYPFEEQPWV